MPVEIRDFGVNLSFWSSLIGHILPYTGLIFTKLALVVCVIILMHQTCLNAESERKVLDAGLG